MEDVFQNRALNWFASGMLDIQLERDPLSQKVKVILNDIIRNHYQDPISVEEKVIEKWAIVRKSPDLEYVQQFGDELMEDQQRVPWCISMTTTDLPRLPHQDDNIIVGDLRYIVSATKPLNRHINKVIIIFAYPERNDDEENIDVKDPIWDNSIESEE